MSPSSLVVCGVVFDRDTRHQIHVDITITDPGIIAMIQNKTLKDFSLDVAGPTPKEG